MRNILKNLPEFLLIGLAVFFFFETLIVRSEINYVMLIVTAIMVAQVIFKNKYFGVFLGIAVGLISFGLFLAVLSDYRKFQEVTTKAIELITVGGLMALAGAVLSAVMIFKYFSQDDNAAVKL